MSGHYTVSEGKTFEPLVDDKYQVEVYKAEPFMGTEYQSSIPQEQVKFTFVVLNDDKTVMDEGQEVSVRGRRLWLQTTTQFSPVGSKKPTNLTQLVAAVFGKELEPAEVEVFDHNDLLGKQLLVMVGQKKRQDGTIGNKILSFSKITKELPKFDESEFADSLKARTNVKKSEPVTAVPAKEVKPPAKSEAETFEADMDKATAEHVKKA
jgi:hypothetical protein